MTRTARLVLSASCLCLAATTPSYAAEWLVDGGFEEGPGGTGWTSWSSAPNWGSGFTYIFDAEDDPYDGSASLYLTASSGSFGVYQEMCVEAGVPVAIDWAWKGQAPGTGWWEVLIVDAAYSYDAVDNPSGHPETFLASKWEKGFGGPLPEPSAEWATGSAELTPTSDVITVVLKCGSTEGGIVEAWFDAVAVTFDTQVLEVTGATPALGKTAGGEEVRIVGRVFPEGATVTIGGAPLVDAIRWSTCEIRGTTPPGDPGSVDVVVTAPGGSATLPGGFRYVPPPTVSAVEPSSGPPAGGMDVTIRGAGFVSLSPGDVAVRIGGVALRQAVVVDEGAITGQTPSGSAGPADVTVTTPFGEVTLAGGFTYVEEGVRFVRGDCNADGEMNITDGIAVLGFLFLGGVEPPCLDACNPDDSVELNISDGIGILNFLFLGGAQPLPPYPDCGVDATEGPTCQAAHAACS